MENNFGINNVNNEEDNKTALSINKLNEGKESIQTTFSISSFNNKNESFSSLTDNSGSTEELNERKLSPRSALIPFVDPLCNPKKPVKIQFSDISSAAFNIRDGIVRTPTMRSKSFSSMFGVDLYLKREYLHVTGSFKERGARFALIRLNEEQKRIGVIAASAGNHALALAYHGQQLGIPVTVVMPKCAPLMKINSCDSFGAKVILHGLNIQECKLHAYELAQENKQKYINGFDNPDVIAGQGTIGLEILEEVKDVDAILVPVGGGGLIAGVALAVKTLKPEVSIIGIESEICPSFANALNGTNDPLFPDQSLADGLSVPTVGSNALLIAQGLIDQMITVSEGSIALAILRLIEVEKSVVEGGGAVGLAALVSGKLDQLRGKRVVAILTGGNIDTTVLGRTIERGLAVDGRLIKFDVVVSDRIAELTAEIAKIGASIKEIFHERAWLSANIHSVMVKIVCETRGEQHVQELIEKLNKKYKQINFPKSNSIYYGMNNICI
uniref:L-serine deaminase n=2 Tax=Meloidogyne incognita TaxID=6306 RepID=A0A914M5H9_MELIC